MRAFTNNYGTLQLPDVSFLHYRMIFKDNHIHSKCTRMFSKYMRMPSNCIRMVLKRQLR